MYHGRSTKSFAYGLVLRSVTKRVFFMRRPIPLLTLTKVSCYGLWITQKQKAPEQPVQLVCTLSYCEADRIIRGHMKINHKCSFIRSQPKSLRVLWFRDMWILSENIKHVVGFCANEITFSHRTPLWLTVIGHLSILKKNRIYKGFKTNLPNDE